MVSSIYGLVDTVKSQLIIQIPGSSKLIEPQLDKIKSESLKKLPSEDQIKSQLCNNNDIEDVKIKFNQYKDSLKQFTTKIEGIESKIDSLIKQLESIQNILNTLSTIIDTLSTIITALEIAVVGLKAGLFALTAPFITGGAVKTISDGIDLIETNVKKYGLVIRSMQPILNFLLPKLDQAIDNIYGFKDLITNIRNLVENCDLNLNACMKDRLIDEFKGVDDSNRIEDISNISLESLIKLSNNNKGVKIEEFKYLGEGKIITYNVETTPQEDLKI
jgi:hypothetical protein